MRRQSTAEPTIAPTLFPRAAVLVHVNQLYALLLHENVCYERNDTTCLNPPCPFRQLLLDVPASQFIPLVRREPTRLCRFRRPVYPFRRSLTRTWQLLPRPLHRVCVDTYYACTLRGVREGFGWTKGGIRMMQSNSSL
jgi:hypothetical protein